MSRPFHELIEEYVCRFHKELRDEKSDTNRWLESSIALVDAYFDSKDSGFKEQYALPKHYLLFSKVLAAASTTRMLHEIKHGHSKLTKQAEKRVGELLDAQIEDLGSHICHFYHDVIKEKGN